MDWKPEHDAVIHQGIAEKWSASVIAGKLGIESRSAVTARAGRLGLHLTGGRPGRTPRAGPPKPRAARRHRPNMAPGTQPLPEPPAAPDPSTAVTIFALERGMCRWPLWPHAERFDAATSLYCGGAVLPDHPYCAHHHALAPPGV